MSSDTERDLPRPTAARANLRVIRGGDGSDDPEPSPPSAFDDMVPEDKSKRPAHQQLQRITIPEWFPWIAQLMQSEESRSAREARGVHATKARPREPLAMLLLILFASAAVLIGIWAYKERERARPIVPSSPVKNAPAPSAAPVFLPPSASTIGSSSAAQPPAHIAPIPRAPERRERTRPPAPSDGQANQLPRPF